jgi:site-specific recombinase XerD
MHLLQAGVPLVYIRDVLGHVDITNTDIYARADTETKRNALEKVYREITPDKLPDWICDDNLLDYIRNL